VAGNNSNITIVAGINAAITTVSGIAAAVSAVATNATNINTVSTNISSVNSVATNIVDVQNAEENAAAAIAAQAAAEAARDLTLAALDSFDDRYLGQYATDPTLDNDGNALIGGALYFNTTDDVMKVYDIGGGVWLAAYASLSGALLTTNNLSDLTNAAAARTNLALVPGTHVQAYDAELTSLAGLSITQGDLIYGSAADTYSKLAKDTNATRYLSNTGTTNNPAWAQINLANGVTGDLPFANLTQGAALTVLANATNGTADFAALAAGSDHQVLRRSGTALAFGAVNLAQAAAVTGILAGANGGTNNAFMQFTGPASTTKTYTLPNATCALLTDNAAVTVPQGGTGIATTTAYGVICGGTTATDALQNAGAGTAGQVLTSNGAAALPSFQSPSGGSFKNKAINGALNVQRCPIGTTDNSYVIDQHRMLLEAANAATFTRETTGAPTGYKYFGRLTAGSGNNNKFGIFHPFEGKNIYDLRGQVVTASILLAATAGLSNIKMGIAEFTGTEDSISGDPISAWGADGVTPTLAANWAFINTPANLSVGTSFAAKSVSATVGASAVNLAVIVWNDDKTTTTTTDKLDFTALQLEKAASATAFEVRPQSLEEELCEWYYKKISGATASVFSMGVNYNNTSDGLAWMNFKRMRSAPTGSVSAAGDFEIHQFASGVLKTCVSFGVTQATDASVSLAVGGWSSGTANAAFQLRAVNGNAAIYLDSRL
jgi:hypothetical protein